MVLFQIDAYGVTALPFKRNPPGAVHCQNITHGLTVQRMQTPSRYAKVIERFRAMKHLEPAAHTLQEVWANSARIVSEEEVA